MASNVVEILVGARDADAKASLDDLRLRLDELAHKVATAKVELQGDQKAEVALDRMAVKLISLDRRTAKPNVSIEGILRAEAEVGALALTLDALSVSEVGDSATTDLLTASIVGLDTALAGTAGTVSAILIPLAALAAILAGPLLASLLPITLGFATFGAVAFGEISKLATAFNSLNTAQAQLAAAKTPAQHAAALHAMAVAMAGLNGPEKALVPLTQQLGNEVSKLMKAVQPEIVKAFGTGLDIIKRLMPAITPLAVAAGKAIDGFLKNIDNWLKSGSGQKFLRWLAVDGPRDIRIFGDVLWVTAQAIGRTFDFLKNAGDSWFRNVTNGVHTLMKDWDFLVASWNATVRDFSSAWDTIKSAFQDGYNFIAGIVSKIEGVLSSLNGALGGIPGKLLGLIGFAGGGIVGAATGGPRSGLTLVGERGPELVRLSAGSRVYNASQTRGMLAGAGGGNTYNLVVNVPPTSSPAQVGRTIVEYIREFERGSGSRWRS